MPQSIRRFSFRIDTPRSSAARLMVMRSLPRSVLSFGLGKTHLLLIFFGILSDVVARQHHGFEIHVCSYPMAQRQI